MTTPQMNQKDKEWLKNKWRPMIAVVYIIICMFDFVIFPALWTVTQLKMGNTALSEWNAMTLANGGMFHIAFGAILGVAAWRRDPSEFQRQPQPPYQQPPYYPEPDYNDRPIMPPPRQP